MESIIGITAILSGFAFLFFGLVTANSNLSEKEGNIFGGLTALCALVFLASLLAALVLFIKSIF